METYFSNYITLKNLEKQADELGFVISASKYDGNHLGLYRKADCWTEYVHDHMFCSGSAEWIQAYLCGLRMIKEYDTLIGISNDKKRKTVEQKRFSKREQKKIVKILKENS